MTSFSLPDLLSKLERIHRLSERPPDPGYAYRHLEHIHALSEAILEALKKNNDSPPSTGSDAV